MAVVISVFFQFCFSQLLLTTLGVSRSRQYTAAVENKS